MIRESFLQYLSRLSDKVFLGRNRTRIVMGTDRKDTRESGYGDGGEGDIESAAIDIVAGYNPESGDVDYESDKSRLLLSEKSDPDDYFNIEKGGAVEGEPSAVLKSDNVYLVARSKTKIIGPSYTILMDQDGNIEIEADSKIELKVGSSKITINSSGIELDAGQGISGKIITDLDRCVGIDPVTGGQIISNFVQSPASPVVNQKVVVK